MEWKYVYKQSFRKKVLQVCHFEKLGSNPVFVVCLLCDEIHINGTLETNNTAD